MTAAELGPGTLIAAYRIVELITSDGTSEIYRAMQLEHDRPVALTVPRGSSAADPDPRPSHRERSSHLQGLDHSAIVAVHDAGVDQDRLYLATQLVSGRTLEQLIAERGSLVADALGTTPRPPDPPPTRPRCAIPQSNRRAADSAPPPRGHVIACGAIVRPHTVA